MSQHISGRAKVQTTSPKCRCCPFSHFRESFPRELKPCTLIYGRSQHFAPLCLHRSTVCNQESMRSESCHYEGSKCAPLPTQVSSLQAEAMRLVQELSACRLELSGVSVQLGSSRVELSARDRELTATTARLQVGTLPQQGMFQGVDVMRNWESPLGERVAKLACFGCNLASCDVFLRFRDCDMEKGRFSDVFAFHKRPHCAHCAQDCA